jgi:hypothetical protein
LPIAATQIASPTAPCTRSWSYQFKKVLSIKRLVNTHEQAQKWSLSECCALVFQSHSSNSEFEVDSEP